MSKENKRYEVYDDYGTILYNASYDALIAFAKSHAFAFYRECGSYNSLKKVPKSWLK